MSIDPPVPQLIGLSLNLLNQAGSACQRGMLVLSGEQDWCVEHAGHILSHMPGSNTYWVGKSAPHGISCMQNPDLIALLGTETEMLVYDAYAGFDPDAFGALCGTLSKGGILILLTPRLSEWPNFPDPEHHRITVAGYPAGEVTGRFLARLSRLILQHPAIVCYQQGDAVPPPPIYLPAKTVASPPDSACLTLDQSIAVEAVIHVVSGHRRRPVVLISDRGRGKSSALGIAAARLIRSGRKQILITAPRQAATQALFAQAAQQLEHAKAAKGSLHLNDASISYFAPDHLLQHPRSADLLLVDEAAAIPTPMLEALLDHYPRIAFATTIHGYEGTGKGFAVRFRHVLDRRFPDWREIRLETPIRWAANDPLEQWLFSALALNASPAPGELIDTAQTDDCVLEILDRDRLAQDESDLNGLFGLLVLAHYRTTPFDLRQLLDGPNLTVFSLRYHGHIVATALMAREGGFDAPTSHAICAGYRRPQGHLLAQSLAAHLGLEEGAALDGARIMRIAVHPRLQRRGLGGRLVQAALKHAINSGLDYLGTSFGATPELLGFWRRHELLPVRVGLRRGASSGTQSVMLLRPITPRGERIFQLSRQRFSRLLPRLLTDALNDMEPGLACALLAASPQPEGLTLDARDWLDLIGFAFARRAYETTLPAIELLTLRALTASRGTTDHDRLLLMKVLQKRDWQVCARRFDLAGHGAVEGLLRKLIGELVLRHADNPTREKALRIQSEKPG